MHVPQRPPDNEFNVFAGFVPEPPSWLYIPLLLLSFLATCALFRGLMSGLNGWASKQEHDS